MNITLPDDLRDLITKRTQQAGLTSVDEYVLHAVLAAEPEDVRNVDVEVWLRDCLGTTPTEKEVTERWQEIEAELVKGLQSGPPIEVTPAFWSERQRVLEERIAARRGLKQP